MRGLCSGGRPVLCGMILHDTWGGPRLGPQVDGRDVRCWLTDAEEAAVGLRVGHQCTDCGNSGRGRVCL